MKKIIRKVFMWLFYLLLPLITYLLIAVLLSYVPVKEKPQPNPQNHTVYISSNGVHLDIIVPRNKLDQQLVQDLKYKDSEEYFAFGWGDKNFYINAPEWSDLTPRIFAYAFFVNSPTLIHLTKYESPQDHWIEVKVTDAQLKHINEYVLKTFAVDDNNQKILLAGKGYWDYDDFYEANGGYSALRNSNSWVNKLLKECGLPACFWTPFDFGVLRAYK